MDPNGGPPPPIWQKMADFLSSIIGALPERPRALLVISAHWETDQPTVHTGANPDLLFDYYGFPEHTYHLRWNAPGAPDVALRAKALLEDAGFPASEETQRGWDHGVFIPMKVALPGADIPTVQLSLRHDLDPAAHIAMGRALEPLRDEGVLIIGSGMSYHNMRDVSMPDPRNIPYSQAFDDALAAAATAADPADRARRLADWANLPFARQAHPREEHLLPLMVVAGAGGDDEGSHVFRDALMGRAVSGFRYG